MSTEYKLNIVHKKTSKPIASIYANRLKNLIDTKAFKDKFESDYYDIDKLEFYPVRLIELSTDYANQIKQLEDSINAMKEFQAKSSNVEIFDAYDEKMFSIKDEIQEANTAFKSALILYGEIEGVVEDLVKEDEDSFISISDVKCIVERC